MYSSVKWASSSGGMQYTRGKHEVKLGQFYVQAAMFLEMFPTMSPHLTSKEQANVRIWSIKTTTNIIFFLSKQKNKTYKVRSIVKYLLLEKYSVAENAQVLYICLKYSTCYSYSPLLPAVAH